MPPDHEAFEAIEWAAAGVTAGYADGTFKPEVPLNKRHAVLFLEAFYDNILGAAESEDFSRADMMMLLKAINDGAGYCTHWHAGHPKHSHPGADHGPHESGKCAGKF